jgi:hypothetical protein
MPQPQPLTGQSGSAMMGVVGLSVIMTLAASGYLMLNANTGRSIDYVKEDRALHFAAESGLMMGASWFKRYAPASYAAYWPTAPRTLTTGAHIVINGHQVRVWIETAPDGNRLLKSVATKGSGQMEETITWKFKFPPEADVIGSKFLPLDYQETFNAHAP